MIHGLEAVSNSPAGGVLEPTERNNGLRITLWVAGALIVYAVMALLLLEILFTRTMGVHLDGTESSPHMSDAAEQLKTQPEWELLSDEDDLKGDLCLVLYCPHLERAWDMGGDAMSCESLLQLLNDSGYAVITHRDNYTSEANFELKNCARGGYLAAEATAANGALSVDVRIEREKPAAGRNTFVLRITKQP